MIGALWASILAYTGPAKAQPAYSVRSVGECSTCHVEPTDWANPEMKDRRCSLNCTTCHVSPAGGGLRTSSGNYYGREAVPMFGHRPSSDASPRANATKGGYTFLKGFSGWAPGSTPSSSVADRYGTIDPDPTFSFGADVRAMAYFPLAEGDYASVFPMQADVYAMARLRENVQLYLDAGLSSSRSTFALDEEARATKPSALDYVKIEELFVKIDRMPYNLYVRAGRLAPTYGWRIPDHTSFVRRDLGFSETRSWFGVEAGINPNYPYANVAVFYQGVEFWPGDTNPAGFGVAASAGVRELGWQAGGSVHYLQLADGGSDLAVGPQWAVNFAPLVYLGELDLRDRLDSEGVETTSLYAYHELQWLVRQGVVLKLKYDWEDPSTLYIDDHLNRFTVGADVSPYTFVEVEPQYRRTWRGGEAFASGGEAVSDEVLFMVHGWY